MGSCTFLLTSSCQSSLAAGQGACTWDYCAGEEPLHLTGLGLGASGSQLGETLYLCSAPACQLLQYF